MSDLCVSDHGDECPEALPGLRLCRPCRRTLERDLSALPGLHSRLGDHLAPGGGGLGTGRVTGTTSRPLPINPGVAALRDQIRHGLVRWTLFVADQRGIGLPDDRVPEIGRWLAGHVEWIAATLPAAEECPPTMRALASRAHGLLNPSGAKRIAIGPCHDSTEAGPCRGTIWATCRAPDDMRPSELYCDGPCGLRKTSDQWRRWSREYLRERMAG